jgi:putative hydrolase of the HAD superfamily
MGEHFEVIGLDADDTLWHSEDSFLDVENRFVGIVEPFVAEGIDVRAALRATERRHLPISGYGVKAYTLSMVECAVGVSQGVIPAATIGEIVGMGLDMLTEPVRLMPDVPRALADLGRDHRLVMITKGDLVHQWRKVELSGLAHLFARIEVVMEKDEAMYRRVLDEVGVTPDRFCMIGNSVRSDVLPVLAIGGSAVHVPYRYTWEHELAEHDGSVPTAETILGAVGMIRGRGEPAGDDRVP